MVVIPFIWFSLLFIIIWIKRGFDISAYATLLFVISSLFSILLVNSGPDSEIYRRYPSAFATIVYCLGNSLIIWPLYRFDSSSLQGIAIHNGKTINTLVYLFFGIFVLLLITRWLTLNFVLTVADWELLRAMAHNDEIVIEHYSGIVNTILLIAKVIGMASSVMVPIFFISICFLKRSWWFNLMAILGSTNVIINGLIGFDRSSVFRWLLLLGLCIVLFWKFVHKKTRKRLVPFFGVLIGVIVVYMVAVTDARFGNTDQGSKGSVIEYAGQPYPNFCNIYDNLNNGEGVTAKYVFPTIHKYILNDYIGNTSRQEELTQRTKVTCNVFYSVLGSFVLDANQVGPFLYIIYYLIIYSILFKRTPKKGKIPLTLLLCFFYMMQIAAFGIIAYTYTAPLVKVSILLLLIYVNMLENSRKPMRINYRTEISN